MTIAFMEKGEITLINYDNVGKIQIVRDGLGSNAALNIFDHIGKTIALIARENQGAAQADIKKIMMGIVLVDELVYLDDECKLDPIIFNEIE